MYVFAVFAFTEIFFRAKNISEGFYIIKKLFTGKWDAFMATQVFSKFSLILSVCLIIFLFVAETKFADKLIESKLHEKKKANIIFGIVILTMILLLGIFQKLSFIYFQF